MAGNRTIDMDTLTEEQQKMLRDAARRGSFGALTRVMKEIERQKEELANYVPKPSAPKLLRQIDNRLREELITVNMLFAKIDKSGDSALDCGELAEVFDWTEEQSDCVMEFVDIDKSGEITPDELDAAIRANRRGQKPQHAVQHEILHPTDGFMGQHSSFNWDSSSNPAKRSQEQVQSTRTTAPKTVFGAEKRFKDLKVDKDGFGNHTYSKYVAGFNPTHEFITPAPHQYQKVIPGLGTRLEETQVTDEDSGRITKIRTCKVNHHTKGRTQPAYSVGKGNRPEPHEKKGGLTANLAPSYSSLGQSGKRYHKQPGSNVKVLDNTKLDPSTKKLGTYSTVSQTEIVSCVNSANRTAPASSIAGREMFNNFVHAAARSLGNGPASYDTNIAAGSLGKQQLSKAASFPTVGFKTDARPCNKPGNLSTNHNGYVFDSSGVDEEIARNAPSAYFSEAMTPSLGTILQTVEEIDDDSGRVTKTKICRKRFTLSNKPTAAAYSMGGRTKHGAYVVEKKMTADEIKKQSTGPPSDEAARRMAARQRNAVNKGFERGMAARYRKAGLR
jgi:hypothetical protein